MAVRDEIECQRRADLPHAPNVFLLTARMRAVLEASAAATDKEEGGSESLRQSLIDLAACAEAMADQLPPRDLEKLGEEQQRLYREKKRAAAAA